MDTLFPGVSHAIRAVVTIRAKALALQTIIDTTDIEIDAMVYALYGLTDEEIKIVEGNEKE